MIEITIDLHADVEANLNFCFVIRIQIIRQTKVLVSVFGYEADTKEHFSKTISVNVRSEKGLLFRFKIEDIKVVVKTNYEI